MIRRVFFWLAAGILLGMFRSPAQSSQGPSDALPLDPRGRATRATSDLLRHYWIGGPGEGSFLPTWNGRAVQTSDRRGVLWERAMAYGALFHAWKITQDSDLARRLEVDWKHTRSAFRPTELESCGARPGFNPAADDAGWSARMYLDAHQATRDPEALARAQGLVRAAFQRWEDDLLGGGLWYSDDHRVKSLYQVALAEAALRIHETTRDPEFLELALRSYTWMEAHLLRSDGLYWVDFNTQGPVGQTKPDQIQEAASVVFLGGNMGMAALHGALHRLTGDPLYRMRALRSAAAIQSRLTTPEGIYLNDRDAWTEGAFVRQWVEEVLPLPGLPVQHAALLQATGRSVFERARTPDGHYGGSWGGPAEGSDSRWYVRGSRPDQLTTSASSIQWILGAAALSPRREHSLSPR